MQEKIVKTLYSVNIICALLMMCALDSDSYAPAIILGGNLLVIMLPVIRAGRNK